MKKITCSALAIFALGFFALADSFVPPQLLNRGIIPGDPSRAAASDLSSETSARKAADTVISNAVTAAFSSADALKADKDGQNLDNTFDERITIDEFLGKYVNYESAANWAFTGYSADSNYYGKVECTDGTTNIYISGNN